VAQAACRIALTHLDAAHAAHARLKDGKDTEALHDFRVALRRTRSVLRAYRPWLGHIPRKLRRRLRALARATNVARDTEVMMDWLRVERRKIRDPHRAGFIWLQALLGDRYEASCAEITREVLKEFAGMEARLRASLTPIANADREAAPPAPSYAVITADLIRQHAAELAEHLEDIGSVDDAEAIHAARIRGKRLRYLIEPLANEIPAAEKIVARMKQFQDRFGVLCDAFVQAREIASVVETAGAEAARAKLDRALGTGRPDKMNQVFPGLIALASRLQAETRRRYAVVERHYLGDRARRFLGPFESFAEDLAGPDPSPVAVAARLRPGR
jgi:CHAD domain-containing protein